MVNFAHNKTFNGTCAPFIYIAGCSPEARHAYTIESRFWLVATSIGFLALLSATIYRYTKISETFNTLRLVLLLYLAGAPLYVHFQHLPFGAPKLVVVLRVLAFNRLSHCFSPYTIDT